LACASCHSQGGQGGRGPALAGLFGKQVKLASGQTVVADEAYIRESILNPQGQIVEGYQPIMPTFKGQVTEDQLVQLIAYIKSLAGKEGQSAAGTMNTGGTTPNESRNFDTGGSDAPQRPGRENDGPTGNGGPGGMRR
jgi:cytochrome c oxidase subunit 2